MGRSNRATSSASCQRLNKAARRRKHILAMAAVSAVSFVAAQQAPASTIYWDGTTAGWDSTSNWSTASNATTPAPSAVPGISDDVVFNITTVNGNETISLNSNQSANSLTFNNTGTTLLQGGGTNRTLTLGSGGINVNSNAGAVTIGSTASGQNVAITIGANQTWTSNSANGASFFNGVTGAAATTVTLTLGGTGAGAANSTIGNTIAADGASDNVIGGPLLNGASGGTLSILKVGSGTWTISGATNSYTGNTTVNQGILFFDNNVKGLGSPTASKLVLGGGTLTLGAPTAARVTAFNGLAVNAGASAVTIGGTGSNNNATLNLAGNATAGNGTQGISRSVGGTVNFAPSSGAIQTAQTNTNGIIGGYATVNGTSWAVSAGTGSASGNITALAAGNYTVSNAGTTTPGVTTGNFDFQASNSSPWTSSTINSLRFNTAVATSLTLDPAGTLTDSSGGILVTTTVGNHLSTITGGTLLGAAGADLIIIQNNTSNGLTIASTIGDNSTSGLTKSGAGLLTLSNAANGYTGATYLNGGITNIAADASLGTAPGSAVANQLTFNGGTLQLGGSFNLATNRGITLLANGGTIDTQGFNSTYAGVIAGTATGGAGTFTKLGTGALILSGANSFVGGTTISAGTLQFAQTNSMSAAGTVIVNSGTTLVVNAGGSGEFTDGSGTSAAGTIGGLLNGVGGQGAPVTFASGSTLGIDTTNAPGNVTYSTAIANTGLNIAALGTGVLNLSGNNSYSGMTSVGSGTGTAGAASTLILSGNNTSATGAVNVGNGATLRLTNINGVAGSALSLFNGSTLQLRSDTNGATFTPASITAISASSTIHFDVNQLSTGSNATLNLAGAISVNDTGSSTDTFNVTGGNGYTLGLGALTIAEGTLNLNPTTANLAIASLTNGNNSGFNTIATTGAGNVTFTGNITASTQKSLHLTVGTVGASTGTVTLSGNNTWNGPNGGSLVTLNSGTLVLNSTNALGGNLQNLTIAGGTLDAGVAINTNPGTNMAQTWTGNFTFAGSNNLNLGTGAITLGGNVTVTANASTFTAGGAIGDGNNGYSLTKAGNGVLVLSGNNTYHGGTTISAGTLFANNATNSLGSGAVALNGGTLGGNGTINNGSNLITVAGGKLGAGGTATTTGTLTTGNQSWSTGGMAVKINDTGNATSGGGTGSGNAGSTTGWDEVVMSGLTSTLSGNSAFAVTLTTPTGQIGDFSASSNYVWQIAQINSGSTPITPGILATTDSTGTNVPTGGELFTLDTSNFVSNNPSSGGTYYLEAVSDGGGEELAIGYNAAPEPGTGLLMMAGGLPMLLKRRRRRENV